MSGRAPRAEVVADATSGGRISSRRGVRPVTSGRPTSTRRGSRHGFLRETNSPPVQRSRAPTLTGLGRRRSAKSYAGACARYESGGWILELRSRRQRGGVEPAAVGLPRCEGPSRLLPILETVAQIVILVRVGRYWQAEAET